MPRCFRSTAAGLSRAHSVGYHVYMMRRGKRRLALRAPDYQLPWVDRQAIDIARYQHHTEEMRFLKSHQWQTAYLGLLFDAGLVAAFQLPVAVGASHGFLAIGGTAAVVAMSALLIGIQFNHRASQKRNRGALRSSTSSLGLPAKIQERKKGVRDCLYMTMFVVAQLVGGFAAAILICFDK